MTHVFFKMTRRQQGLDIWPILTCIDHLSLLSGGMLRWLNSGPGQTQPLPSRGLPWLVKVGRRAEKKFLPGFKMPKQAAPVMQGANCTLANIIGTTLCNTIYNLHLNFEVVLNCSYALFFIVSILTSAVTTNNPFISMEKVIILTKPEVQIPSHSQVPIQVLLSPPESNPK